MTVRPTAARNRATLVATIMAGCLTLVATARTGNEIAIQAGWAGGSPRPIIMTCRPSGKSFPLEGYEGSLGPAVRIPAEAAAEIGVQDEQGMKKAGAWQIPAEGDRFILLMTNDDKGGFRATAVNADGAHLPWGAAVFANLSKKRLRCSLDGQVIELAAGQQGLCPLRLKARKVTHCRVEYQNGKEWVVSSAGPLILTGDMRAIIAIGPRDGLNGNLQEASLIESNPDSTKVPAFKSPPPLPDQPAK